MRVAVGRHKVTVDSRMALVVDTHRPVVGVHNIRKVRVVDSHRLVEVQDIHEAEGSRQHMDVGVAFHKPARSRHGSCRSRCVAHTAHLDAAGPQIWSAALPPSSE